VCSLQPGPGLPTAQSSAEQLGGRIDHDNISIMDPGRVGLHPDAMESRARIYRWLRRSRAEVALPDIGLPAPGA
jgi:hypothetical protein